MAGISSRAGRADERSWERVAQQQDRPRVRTLGGGRQLLADSASLRRFRRRTQIPPDCPEVSAICFRRVLHDGPFLVELNRIRCDLPAECRHSKIRQGFGMCSRRSLLDVPRHPERIQQVRSLGRSSEPSVSEHCCQAGTEYQPSSRDPRRSSLG